jgi:DNA-binding response OmpR family regulator
MAGERILIVEDDVALAGRPLQRMLLAQRYDVVDTIAKTTEEAVALTRQHQPDVVLLDIRIPPSRGKEINESEGVNAAKLIKGVRDTGIVFISCTKVTDDLMRDIHRVAPDAIYLTRPWTAGQVLASVRQVLTKRAAPAIVPRHCEVFVCYAREDQEMEKEMRQHLRPLEAAGVRFWDDHKLTAGTEWKRAVERALATSDTAVVFVSIDFMNSEFIQKVEWPTILKAHSDRNMEIIPVFVGPVSKALLEATGLLDFEGVNRPDNPLNGKAWNRPKRERLVWVPLCDRLFQNCSKGIPRSV